jgi:Flp pilus assembly protein TadG
MKPKLLPARRSEAGTAFIEFAVILPVLLLIVFGLVEVGRYAYFSIMVGNAARAGAQYGAQNMVTVRDASAIEQAAKNDASAITLNATASYSCACSDGTTSTCSATDCTSSHRLTYVLVTTSGTFDSLLHFPGVPSSITVTSTAVMRAAE